MLAIIFLEVQTITLDIAYFIKELILLNECVILQGIGGFETSYRNAVLDKSKKHINPPGKKIYFRPDLVMDNGVLESYIARTLNIEREEASRKIDAFVRELKDSIKNEGKVFLEGIGEFVLAKDNSIKFNEIGDENYLADSFGLEVLDIEIESKSTDSIRKPELQPLVPDRKKYTGWYIAIGILLLLIIATTVILITSSPGSSLFAKHGKQHELEGSDVIVFGPEENVEKDSAIREIGHSIDESTVPKKALSLESTTINRPQLTDQTYYLIAGSFKYLNNAQRLRDNLIQKGFSPTVKVMGNYNRVIIGTYNDKQLAIAELRRIRGQLDQSVWLMENQN